MTEVLGVITASGEVQGEISSCCIVNSQESKPIYQGVYEVTPNAQAQLLQTAGKLLEQDITVKEIAFSKTSNESGTTVTIGG